MTANPGQPALNPIEALWLPNAARTTQQQSANLINPNGFTRLLVWLDVTAASGTGGLTLHVDAQNPGFNLGIGALNSQYQNLFTAPAAIAAVISRMYALGPGTDGTNNDSPGSSHLILPYTWRLRVTVGDATSYTYSVSYTLLP